MGLYASLPFHWARSVQLPLAAVVKSLVANALRLQKQLRGKPSQARLQVGRVNVPKLLFGIASGSNFAF